MVSCVSVKTKIRSKNNSMVLTRCTSGEAPGEDVADIVISYSMARP